MAATGENQNIFINGKDSLLDVVDALPTDRMCYFTGHENWLSIEILDPHGLQRVYEVFFNYLPQRGFLIRKHDP